MEFKRHDIVRHVKTGELYVILCGPRDGLTHENTGEAGYIYQAMFFRDVLWYRPAKQMEDGRFAFERSSTHGAEGRFPEY